MQNTHVFPAYAGMSRWRARSASWRLGFPRLRGDEPFEFTVTWDKDKVFPAYAGMSPVCSRTRAPARCFPRLRGDEPRLTSWSSAPVRFSPPTRG